MLARNTLEAAMQRALTVSLRGPARDRNPQVGCVILDREGRIVAEGWHRGAGTPHAEVDALTHLPAEWRNRGSELTAVVTLEPCNHQGRTGPCSQALVDAGIGAAAYAVSDPGEQSGGGAAALRAAGLEVESGILVAEARRVLGPWLRRQDRTRDSDAHPAGAGGAGESSDTQPSAHQPNIDSLGAPSPTTSPRPHVTVKWAQTLDGRAAAADGTSQWITGEDARADVHRRRAEADAILVGTGTLLADDPALTARAETGGLLVPANEQPLPIVLGRREIPTDARVRQHPALAARGQQEVTRLTGDNLAADLADLHSRGIERLFVEGGPAVASSFIAAGLVDDVLIYVAPALLGGPMLALSDIGIDTITDMQRLRITHVAQLGADLLIKAQLAPRQGASTPHTLPTHPPDSEEHP